MSSKEHSRRRFLKGSAALAGVALGATRSGKGQTPEADTSESRLNEARAYGVRSGFEDSARTFNRRTSNSLGRRGPALYTPLQVSRGIITPSPFHYVISHGYIPPKIDPRQHRLMIHGMVDRPLIFTLEELQRLPSVSRTYFLECAGNTGRSHLQKETVQETHGWTSCSEWTGVPLSLLLNEAGVHPEASWLVAEGAEPGKHTKSIPLEKAMDDILVAYGQNGEAVRPEQGYPLRLVVPGWEGISNVKWLRRIKVVDEPYMGRSEATQYPSLRMDGKARWYQWEIGPKSAITFPSGGQRLPGSGFYEITGLAWSGGGTVRRVELSTDGGRTWKDAELQEPVLRLAHTRFRMAWNWNGEEAVLQSRCTDERGVVQPTLAEFGKVWGVAPDYWQSTTNFINHFNVIFPWKVSRDGSVHNALF